MKKTLGVVALFAFATTANAQVAVHERDGKVAKEQQLQVLMEKTAGRAVHLSVETRPVPGAPYSAEAVNESIQVLADGNRIVRRSVSRVYRDGAGRTRREELNADGQAVTIAINDAVSGTSVVIDPAANIAHRTAVAKFIASRGVAAGSPAETAVALYYTSESKPTSEPKLISEGELKAKQQAELKAVQEAGTRPHATTGHATVNLAGGVTWVAASPGEVRTSASKEDLGDQTIEGVKARGTRTTTVIPAGAIGNDLPITVTSEEWFSPDLKVLVMTKHADPRSGETTYRLTGIARGEPSPSLFEVPAGVTIK